jgi:3-deoxy-D-manno-octulosonic-acid transferase
MWLLYNLLLTVLAPLWVPVVWYRSRKRKEQPNWQERYGRFPFGYVRGERRIWVHAVSVGEVLAISPILRLLRQHLTDHKFVLSVTTSSGHQTAKQTPELYDHLVYFPLDVPLFMLTAMQKVQPDAVVVMETELWMNFLWAAQTFDAPTILINGRISDRSFPRAMAVRPFYRALLKQLNLALMQTEVDANRLLALGAPHVEVFGNSKYDQALPAAEPLDLLRDKFGLDDRPVIVLGSTRGAEEEAFVIEALSGLENLKDLQIVHAPRHIETAEGLASAAARLGLPVGRRSLGQTGQYLVLDTYGELASVYALASVVVIGGGFSNLGGQNLVQPLAHGKPVIHGPHMQNFREATAKADAVGASLSVSTPLELRSAIARLLADEGTREQMGMAAKSLIEANLGASERYAARIAQVATTRAAAQAAADAAREAKASKS